MKVPTMEAWPAVAWVLLMTSIADWLKVVQSRDFTMMDIILLHPSNNIQQLQQGTLHDRLNPADVEVEVDPHRPGELESHCYRFECFKDATPHPGGFKCFTCEDAADNYKCNRWAPDVYCPKDARYCYTLHMMDNHGDSVSVTKRCVTLEDCRFTGCADVTDNGYQVCSSCCEGNICNVLVPRNQSSAIFSSISPLVSSSRRLHPATLSYITFIMCLFYSPRFD